MELEASPINEKIDPRPDLQIADAKIEELRLRAHQHPHPRWTLTGMIKAWSALCDEIDEGYRLTIYDYTNDLYVRSHLAEVLAVLPAGPVREWVQRDIEAGDLRYKEVTHAVAHQIHGGPDANWWFFRVPNRIVGELAEDLGSDGELSRG